MRNRFITGIEISNGSKRCYMFIKRGYWQKRKRSKGSSFMERLISVIICSNNYIQLEGWKMYSLDKIGSKKQLIISAKLFLLCLGMALLLLAINLFYSPFLLKSLLIILSYITKAMGIILLICLFTYLYRNRDERNKEWIVQNIWRLI